MGFTNLKDNYPKWFNYEVDYIVAVDTTQINERLIECGLDAADVITIIPYNSINTFRVYVRKPVGHK